MRRNHNSEKSFKHMEKFHDVASRILLIDDRVGIEVNNRFMSLVEDRTISEQKDNNKTEKVFAEIVIRNCKDHECQNCSESHQCKLHTIKQLMDEGIEKKHSKSQVFQEIGGINNYFYWKEDNIETFYCSNLIRDFITDESILEGYDGIHLIKDGEETIKLENENNPIFIKCNFHSKIDKNKLNIQIIGVRDVGTALLLMSKYKFDMIFCDYLLDYKSEKKEGRHYANQLFDFLSHDYKEEIKKENIEGKRNRLNLLDRLRHAVLDNRGPLGKYWIMPVTGFNQAFIQDLYRNQINLIDYRWNISNGVDPITTPWQFLYHLNRFIELQLRSCVYQREQLLQFILYTCEDLKDIVKLDNNPKVIDFETFKSFMGSEYATFMQLYGNKLPIRRDALIGYGDSDNKSLFATYIWNNFYDEPKYYDVIELHRLAQKFYHQASTMYNDHTGRQRLNEAFANLDFFIRSNLKVRDIIDSENELSVLILNNDNNGLAFLRKVIAICTKGSNQELQY